MNFSDRQLGIVADTDPYRGNSSKKVAQAIRDFGLIPEEMLPFKDFASPSEYFEPKPLPTNLINKGREFLEEYKVLYENVSTDIGSIKTALTFAPLGMSVFAWTKGQDGVFIKPKGQRDNHFCVCYGYDDEKRAWKIFDSYDNFTKLYSYNAKISVAKRFYIKKRTEPLKTNWVADLFKRLSEFLSDIIKGQ